MTKKKKILFLGNSHTYFNDMPELFRRMCEESGVCQTEVSMLAFPSVTYGYHLQQETSLRFALVYGNYDVLIMQQAAHSPCPSREETLRDGSAIIRQARRCRTVPMQILPWAEQYSPGHQEEINSIYKELSEKEHVPLIPVGTVFERARDQKGIPGLYWQDGEHGSPWGSYAAAATIYASLFHRSPVGLKNESLRYAKATCLPGQEDWESVPCPLEPEACRRLQELVWDCVSTSVIHSPQTI